MSTEEISEILDYVGSGITALALFPLFIKSLNYENLNLINKYFIGMQFLGSGTTLTAGILNNNIPLMISSAGVLTATTMISVLKCKNYKNNKNYYYFDLP
jgi:hypothetical protein